MMETWLKCDISEGMFPNERLVRGKTFRGELFSLFAPIDSVKTDEQPNRGKFVPGFMSVEPIAQDDRIWLVRLPAESFEEGKLVSVNAAQLHEERVRQEA